MGDKGQEQPFLHIRTRAFLLIKTTCFFLIERCCATMFPPLQVKQQIHESCRTQRTIASQNTFLHSGSEAKTSKKDWAIYTGGLASVISLKNICHRLCPLPSQQHRSTCTPSSYEKLYLSILYTHTKPPNLHSINIYFMKVRARCQPGFKQLIDQLPIIKHAHPPSSGGTA